MLVIVAKTEMRVVIIATIQRIHDKQHGGHRDK